MNVDRASTVAARAVSAVNFDGTQLDIARGNFAGNTCQCAFAYTAAIAKTEAAQLLAT